MPKKPITVLRYIAVIFVSLFFIVSFRADIQVLEGSLVGSRFIGFHLIDPFATLQVLASLNSIPMNLIIGTVTIGLFYIFMGGRLFCSWVCPYGLLSELGEKLHFALVKRRIIKGGREISLNRYLFFALFLGLSLSTGLLIFEIFNVVGILSRFMIYGASAAVILVVVVLIFEIFFIRRVWCRTICPIGSTYGLLNYISAGKIARTNVCDGCGQCTRVCIEPSLLDFSGRDFNGKELLYVNGAACTLCGKCIEVCPKGGMSYHNRLKNIV